MTTQLHRVQVMILHALRHAETARFSTLMRPTGLQSDSFKFYVRKLIQSGYIEKTESGHYRLTAKGKEFANNLDETRLTTQRQPKLSILLVAQKPDTQGEPIYLFQERRRNPFFGYWSCIGGPVQWGENAEATAARELKKQTGLSAVCKVRAFYRQHDYEAGPGLLLEDKLFIIVEATEAQGELANTWYAGYNQWMTVEKFKQQAKYFSTVCDAINMLKNGETYAEHQSTYTLEDY